LFYNLVTTTGFGGVVFGAASGTSSTAVFFPTFEHYSDEFDEFLNYHGRAKQAGEQRLHGSLW
jgi:hypothetical protein